MRKDNFLTAKIMLKPLLVEVRRFLSFTSDPNVTPSNFHLFVKSIVRSQDFNVNEKLQHTVTG